MAFRVFTLVTGNDTDPSSLEGKDGSGRFTMRFKVNGADIFSRGGNMIPMEEMEGRSSAAAHRQLVKSAVEGGMNTFRLWGGGIYEYDAWYDACDEMGVMIYHDMMFAQGNHSPRRTPTQEAEIRHQVRRLSHHPSIVIWDGCNECDGHGIYASFVMTTVVDEDKSRAPWPSCPADGWTNGVDRLWGLPNGSPLGMVPLWATTKQDSNTLSVTTTDDGATQNHGAAAEDCAYIENNDYDVGSTGPLPHVQVTGPADCCAKCAAYNGCWAATFDGGDQCWMKTKEQTLKPSWNDGRVGCWPPGHGPIPPVNEEPRCNPAMQRETHGYYQHGTGYATVDSPANLESFDPNLPPRLDPSFFLQGPQCQGTYASEFGGVAMSSFESMAPTLLPQHWGLHNPAMHERNYAMDNLITVYSNIPWPSGFDGVAGEAPFKKFLYLGMIGQALWLKSTIEGRRSRNTFGVITWQYNEIWPTGGWGSIEYGTVGYTPGQVLGGRWKPMQHWMRDHVFDDWLVSCGRDARCLIRNDDPIRPLQANATIAVGNMRTSQLTVVRSFDVSLKRGGPAVLWTCALDGNPVSGNCTTWDAILPRFGCAADGSDCFMQLTLAETGTQKTRHNFELFTPPFKMNLYAAKVVFQVGSPAADNTVPVTITSDKPALFVTLTTLASGRFSRNAFILLSGPTVVHFLPFGDLDYGQLASTLRVEHFAMYGIGVHP